MTLSKTFATGTTALALTLAPLMGAAPAFAQDTTAPMTEAPAATAEYSDEMLAAFVSAALDVAELRQSYQARLESSPTPEEQQAIVNEANAEILGVVESAEGITVEEYIEIGQTAADDAELNTRIMALMQQDMPTEE